LHEVTLREHPEPPMSRRFSEAQFSSPTVHSLLPGFVACPMTTVPPATFQLWQAMYQYAFAKAVAHALEDSQPTKYQRLMLRVSVN
jgi:hypothetical protein